MQPNFDLANAVAVSVEQTQEEVQNRKEDKEHQDVAVGRKTPSIYTDLVKSPENPRKSQKDTLKDLSAPVQGRIQVKVEPEPSHVSNPGPEKNIEEGMLI